MQQSITPVVPVNSPRAFDLPSPDAYAAHLMRHNAGAVAGIARNPALSPLATFLQDVFRTQDVRVHPMTVTIDGQVLPAPRWMQRIYAHEKQLVRESRISCAQARNILVAALND